MARPFSRRAGQPRSRGQTLVEVALVLPLFLLMLMILFDFGRVVYAQHTINQDAQEAVRRGIVSTVDLTTDPAFIGRYAAIRAAARTMAPAVPITDASISGAPVACTGTPPGPPVDPIRPDGCFYPNGTTGPNATVVVNIQITVNFITPIIGNILGDGITLTARAEQIIQS